MNHNKGYIAIIIVLSLLVAAAVIYTIWAYKQKYPSPDRTANAVETAHDNRSRTGKDGMTTSGKDLKEFGEELARARKLEEKDDFLGAKKRYENLLPVSGNPEELQREIYRLNIKILFSPLVTEPPDGPMSEVYTVKAGDNLEKIAGKYGTTIDLLRESNEIENPRNIQIGDRYKVVIDEFRMIISRSKNTLTLIAGEMVIKEYPIGTGEYNKTPLGDFSIKNKMIEPPWKGIPYGDERNVLGTRWMGLRNEGDTVAGYGIHGTWEPETIGESVSQGCVRLYNADVEELFKIVPLGTQVKIIE